MDPLDHFIRGPTLASRAHGDPIRGRREPMTIDVDVPIPQQTFSAELLAAGARARLDTGREVGRAYLREVDIGAGTLRLTVTLDHGITPTDLTGHALLVEMCDLEVIRREPLRIALGTLER